MKQIDFTLGNSDATSVDGRLVSGLDRFTDSCFSHAILNLGEIVRLGDNASIERCRWTFWERPQSQVAEPS